MRERWFWFALPVVFVLVAGVTYALVPGTEPAPEPASSPTAVPGPPQTETPDTTVEMTAHYTERWALNTGWVRELPEPVTPSSGVDCPTAGRQTHDNGAVDRGSSWVVLNVRARRPTTLRLLSLRAEIVERTQVGTGQLMLCVPAPESYLALEPTGGDPVNFVIDGDSSESWEWRPPSGGEPEELGFGEISQTELTAFARACDCRWRLEVEAVVDGMRHRWRLDDADRGQPFRTSAPPPHSALQSAQVWCAPDGNGRLTTLATGDCPSPLD